MLGNTRGYQEKLSCFFLKPRMVIVFIVGDVNFYFFCVVYEPYGT